jgi:inositol oxygenase
MNNKNIKLFRDYTHKDSTNSDVVNTYRENHLNQTVDFVKEQLDKHCKYFNKINMDVWTALDKLNTIKDESDPDLDLPQIVHAFQTAEGLRKEYPNIDWLHLVGLLHDLGKIIMLPELGNQSQWSTVGDTFPVGCKHSEKIVFCEFFNDNLDTLNPVYNSKYGIYKEKCGINNLLMSFGRDEYMYAVLKHNSCAIPELGLQIIRYHSFYSWHKDNEYEYLMDDGDATIKEWCSKFSKCDLYTKDNNKIPDIDKLKPYYQSLIRKYFINTVLEW